LGSRLTEYTPYRKERGEFFCRACNDSNLSSILDLGKLPLANDLSYDKQGKYVTKYPLNLMLCQNCGLGQIADLVTPNKLFKDYRYLSSMSSTFLKHASDFVSEVIEREVFSDQDWVLEIASNDGYLLRNFQREGIEVLGIEPAENVASISNKFGIHTISEFFTKELAENIFLKYGYPKLIIANNVLAHVPDLVNFLEGLRTLCGPDTKISIENPSLVNILLGMQFDTVYHEHYSYLSATAMKTICGLNDLNLYRIEKISTHGGSNRYWLARSKSMSKEDPSVEKIISEERLIGILDLKKWEDYSHKVRKILNDFDQLLKTKKSEGGRVYGYGAAAKASTILNSINLEENLIQKIADSSLEKQGRYLYPCNNPIISPSQLVLESPTDIIIFPWNIKDEIIKSLMPKLDGKVKFWCIVPEVSEVTFATE
jgi:hypothetical protein